MLKVEEVANLLGVSVGTVRRWGKSGKIKTYPYNDRNGCLYDHPGVNSPLMKRKAQPIDNAEKRSNYDHLKNLEVQYAN